MLIVRDSGIARTRSDLCKKAGFRGPDRATLLVIPVKLFLIHYIQVFLHMPDRQDRTIPGSLTMSIFQQILGVLLMLKEFGENLN